MTDLDTLYGRLSSGESLSGLAPHTGRALIQRANQSFMDGGPAERQEALCALIHLDHPDALDPLRAWVSLSQLSFQENLLDLATTRRLSFLLRELAREAESPVAVRAIEVLHSHADRQSLPALRPLLKHGAPIVRAQVATFMGEFGGPSLIPSLRALLSDPEEGVQAAAEAAITALNGDEPLPRPQRHRAVDAPSHVTPTAMVLAPIVQTPGAIHWAPNHTIPLPAELPTETLALLRLLGQVDPDDRDDVFNALRQRDSAELTTLLHAYRPGGDSARSTGLGLAALQFGTARWVSPLRALLGDPAPDVRACALLALAQLSGPSILPVLRTHLDDPESSVRLCAVHSMAQIGQRHDCRSLAVNYLRAHVDDPDEAVSDAAKEAINDLNA